MKRKVLILTHVALQILAFTSWLWLDYRVIAIVAVLHLVMLGVLKGCPLSQFQFTGDKEKRFYEWELEKLGIRLAGKRRQEVRLFMQYLLPIIIVTLAAVLQVVLGITPIVSL